MTALRAASGAQGFNIGMNIGGVAGAGIAAHLHQHVVPRWGGDANFMPVVGRTKVLPDSWRTPASCSPTRGRLTECEPAEARGTDGRGGEAAAGGRGPGRLRPARAAAAAGQAGLEAAATFSDRCAGSGSWRR